ncbi:MAG TPA: GTP-dependent dephospho-CoA kinase family protein [Methanospirillum sp.]|nr:GTP-dependent dephospho-CoA kinase family protein [Methanospirillum sp.]
MLSLPEDRRHFFQRPFGVLYPSLDPVLPLINGRLFFSVGDVVTDSLIRAGMPPAIAIIDGQTMRQPHDGIEIPDYTIIYAKNPPGCLTREMIQATVDAVTMLRIVIQVEGEEDLAVVPLALNAPDSALILYGQPGEGVVLLEVTASVRQKAQELLDCFTPDET